MGKRRAARELALKFLYQTEFNPDDREVQMEQFCERADTHLEITEFMKVLVDKVFAHTKEVDTQLEKFSNHWALDRMSMIDRNILRLGISELLFDASTPPKVVINEAVEIAKKFGSADSPDFINGILDKVFKETGPPIVK
ncbi:MAG: transcription antitermination factor NusB [Nitrospina sp.]|jgi:transcription antitermination protein NusB|nr:transcription antitermination factor NusB [Nitrospina sp.]MBT3414015.1 transcription antitermination factor NusB [Nitrospina sp.]MBT4105731.1 transcription antitermination factor NusB [Nitrospina sp.]MBT4621886.1 transcription antitermination factor NusB [Nitrospina sp.]MBT5260535.1 transcription antitermination factor NusB [Nitrospina sp.]